MRIYDESTPRRTIWCAQINWSRELTFSERQINYIMATVPHERGVYCIYAKHRTFAHEFPDVLTRKWSRVVYIGSGWLDDRLCAHLKRKKNDLLADYLAQHVLAYRFDRIEHSDFLDWPKTVEASLLQIFENEFGGLPCANRRREAIPEIPIDRFEVQQSPNFDFLARG
jgi:hypothetical protein